MMSKLLHKSKYRHLKFIYEYPNGIKHRFKNGDKWVESLNHPQVKTYYQFFHNQQTMEHQIRIRMTEKEQSELQIIKHSYKPGVAKLTQFLQHIKPFRPDDQELEQDVDHMTFKQFIQEGRSKITDLHSLVLHVIAFIVLLTILYFMFLKENFFSQTERVKVLNAQIIQSYHFDREEASIKEIIKRIEYVHEQFQKKLSQSEAKAEI